MPIYAAVPLILAVGVREAWKANRVTGFGAAVLVAGLFAVQEIHWYRTLAPDERLARAIACLREGDVRYAWADDRTSYKLTFLTNEASIVAPTDADRYPPFQRPSPRIAMRLRSSCRQHHTARATPSSGSIPHDSASFFLNILDLCA